MNSAFEERSAWVTFLSLVAIFVVYGIIAAQMLSAGVTDVVLPFVPLFAVTVVLLAVLLILGHIVAAVLGRPEARDERDVFIERRAETNSSWILAAGVLLAAFALALPIGKAWIANGLLMALFVDEIANYGLRLYYYRRGF